MSTPALYFQVSPECRLADLLALLDSYMVEVWHGGILVRRCPISRIAFGTPLPSQAVAEPGLALDIQIDPTIDIRLAEYIPVGGETVGNHRWPFYVREPLTIKFTLGDQWWQFSFSPGKTCGDRAVTVQSRAPPTGIDRRLTGTTSLNRSYRYV